MMIIIKLFIAKIQKKLFSNPETETFYYLCIKIVYFTKK